MDEQQFRASQAAAAALEAERRRLAGLLDNQAIAPLSLLLAQANAYEQTFATNPQAQIALSVLTSLARQALQQIRDLQTTLYPTILESLGLEPALEALASQVLRAQGLEMRLNVERLRERLPLPLELALFRATQDAVDLAVHYTHASQITIQLERRADQIRFSLSDNGLVAATTTDLQRICERIEQLGGIVHLSHPPEHFALAITFALKTPTPLTPGEMRVLQLLVEGLSNKEIAVALSVRPRTINFHLDNIYSKLGVNSRTEAAIYALRQGLASWLNDQGSTGCLLVLRIGSLCNTESIILIVERSRFVP